jgi:hypothetical protein
VEPWIVKYFQLRKRGKARKKEKIVYYIHFQREVPTTHLSKKEKNNKIKEGNRGKSPCID